jgi:acyl carrier protein
MLDRGQIQKIFYRAIDQVNELLLEDDELAKDDSTILIGEGSGLSSLGFVNLILALEEELLNAVGLDLNLMEELNIENADAQPSAVGDFVDMLLLVIRKKQS